ncbi:MFS transporter [Candidatus Latescibacterota bacterium]
MTVLDQGEPAGARGFFHPLTVVDFRRLWVADGLWWLAMWMEMVILGWVALSLTNSAWWVALLGFFRSAPLAVTGLFGAAVTERFRRRHLILFLQLVSLGSMAALALLFGAGVLAYWHLAVAAFVNGTAWSLDWPTRRALIPDLVGRDRIVDAMLLENLLQGSARILGPLLAGSAMEWLGTLGSLMLLCLMGALAALFLARMQTDSRSPDPARSVGQSLARVRTGLSHMVANPRLLGVVLITVTMNVWAFPFQALLPVFARDVLGQGPVGLGLLASSHGVGVLLGLGGVYAVRGIWSNEWVFGAGSVLSCVGLMAFAGSSSFSLSLLVLVLAGAGQACFSTMQSSITLVEASEGMRARAMGTVVLAIGVGPLGRLQCGAMAAAWGAPVAVGAMALWAALSTAGVMALVRGFLPSRQRTSSSSAADPPGPS